MSVPGHAAGTAPPDAGTTGWRRLRATMARSASTLLLPLAQRVARDRIGGQTVDDALLVARRLADEGMACTLGFWDTPDCTHRQVADIHLEAVERLAALRPEGYVSIKPPALGFDAGLADALAQAAARNGVRLHADSHGPETAEPACAMIEAMAGRHRGLSLGTTLPGRWSRSLADGDRAIGRGLAVRVVKGQWPDPTDPRRDPAAGFLDVVDRLAGRARHVAVASHDLEVVAAAVGRLRAAGTSCEIELIHAVPMAPVLRWARANAVAVRIYIPFGKGFMPNIVGLLRRDPALAWRIVRGLAVGDRGA
ncbi:MAG TPA: hypothetical protein PKA13_17790 [Geminicoccaceae bacterium]|nr:hypothetical protein [Geminicoccus sp.]HMU51632.1 hypothetical protein [Geminicoccaceae bacterium]